MPATAAGTDAALLAAFARDGDGAAFAELVRRHGPLARGVCRRVLRGGADADDAYQAALIILARRAGGLRDPGRVGPWLHGVAYRCARRARRAAAHRHARQVPLPDLPARPADDDWHDVRPVLDAEVARLPDKLRAALVLCELQGLDRTAAAAALGVPPGTVSSRLARAKDALRAGLVRRGLAPTAAALAAVLTESSAGAGPPAAAPSAAAFTLARMELTVFLPSVLVKLLLALFTAAALTAAGVALLPADPPKLSAPDADPATEERVKLAGGWEVVGVDQGEFGSARARAALVGARVEFTAGEVRLPEGFRAVAGLVGGYPYAPASGATPKRLDLSDAAAPEGRRAVPCGYQLDGDVLTLRLPFPSARPLRTEDFAPATAGTITVVRLRRAKPNADAAAAEMDRLRGKWTVERVSRDNADVDRKADPKAFAPWAFVDDLIRTGPIVKYRVDPTASPKRIDWRSDAGWSKVVPGVYALDGDTLTVRMGARGNAAAADANRPGDLARGRPGSTLYVLRRVKPSAAAAAEMARFVGAWQVASGSQIARPDRTNPVRSQPAVFTADEMRIDGVYDGPKRYGYSVDPAAPGRIDLEDRYWFDTVVPGIYKFDGDTLTIRFGLNGDYKNADERRPKRFAGPGEDFPGGQETTQLVLRRVQPDNPAAERVRLAGVWDVAGVRLDGVEQQNKSVFGAGPVRFADDTLEVPGWSGSARVVVDPAANPRRLDLTRTPAGGGKQTFEGVYALDGDTLTWHLATPDPTKSAPPRPPGVAPSAPGTGHLLVTLRHPAPLAAAERAKLAGEWRVVSGTQTAGVRLDTVEGASYVFRDDTFEFADAPFVYALDPTQSPRHIDLKYRDGRVAARGIYRLDGDTVVLHFGDVPDRPAPRPVDFAPGPKSHYLVLARVKPNAAK